MIISETAKAVRKREREREDKITLRENFTNVTVPAMVIQSEAKLKRV